MLVSDINGKLEQMTKERNDLRSLADAHASRLAQQADLNSTQASELGQLKTEVELLTHNLKASESARQSAIQERNDLQSLTDKQATSLTQQEALVSAHSLELTQLKSELQSLARKLEASEAEKQSAIKERDDLQLLAQTLESTLAPARDTKDASAAEVLQYQVDSLATEVAALKLATRVQASSSTKPAETAQASATKPTTRIENPTQTSEAMQLLCKTQSETLAMLKATNESYLAQASDFAATLKTTRETASLELQHLKATSQAKLSQLRSLNESQAQELAALKAARETEQLSPLSAAAATPHNDLSSSQSLSEASLRQASFHELRVPSVALQPPPSVASSVSGFDVVDDDLGSDSGEIEDLW